MFVAAVEHIWAGKILKDPFLIIVHILRYFKSTNDDFVGLVLDYTIGSEYANTLTVVPKIAENHKHIGHESTDL